MSTLEIPYGKVLKNLSKEDILNDYKLAHISRQISLIGRKEVLRGNADFGIFGDGKEIAQLAAAHFFREGDWRSGYYRDQTFMLATGMTTPEELFAQLYGDTDAKANPGNAGRSMVNHYGTPNVTPDGQWLNLVEQKNTSSDIAPTAGQMPRMVGLAYASKLYRNNKDLHEYTQFSDLGNEVVFGTIGDASSAEGHFWETVNASAVLQIPLALSVWDDGYGISVPGKYQITKANISEVLSGFEKKNDNENGILIYRAKGWDYARLLEMYGEGIARCREKHIPVLFHVNEMTQPMGHSSSGSHERYKPKERLEWEAEFDAILKMKEWLLVEGIATEKELKALEKEAEDIARKAKDKAWKNIRTPVQKERDELVQIVEGRSCSCVDTRSDEVDAIAASLKKIKYPIRKDTVSSARRIMRNVCRTCPAKRSLQHQLSNWLKEQGVKNHERYSSKLYSETEFAAVKATAVPPVFTAKSETIPGREILLRNFDKLFAKYPLLVTFGEDTGALGDVNKGLEGMQAKYGELRVTDTGIRETTILGQGIGLALRGMRPIVEIQYFDYIMYALQTLSDDLATLHWRTAGAQKAPVIIRTRGHRLIGIWHSGSPLSMIINSLRGIHVCVPRDMTQAAGMYNTLLESDDPALVVESLNGYRIREKCPENLGEFKVPLGIPEIMHEGTDVTLVTYGSCVRIAQEAVKQLDEFGISVELIDVQTLLPFDTTSIIGKSLSKTNRIIFFDEDVPGGTTAFMMQQVMEKQQGYFQLDSAPKTITAQSHRPAYTTDGDYFSNPNAEDVFDAVYEMISETNPKQFPPIYPE
ncbi:transketolase [Prolixibacter bellariivorans]|uniref:3-methyl-2-oxobutanoate dehydrogenase (2-methylpropanoyl-transferring) n=1 Tax=Prolixibacter bellariivorans TaxID=314319 RepID=A0A5M4B5A2_9BACT|nr:alpha-ketoacid dehydrogenase subunit alpha/beta [Prolixibacter bellariivorans]GET35056.1 transketolase [Prolixibacter bellariivorans]